MIKLIFALCRIYLSASIAFSAFASYFISSRELNPRALALFTGIFMFSCGASALNQLQEIKTDFLMRRTMNRPLPSGRITQFFVLVISVILLAAGFSVLYTFCGAISAILAIFTMIWYNGVYTPLKKVTVFSPWIGALTGSLPLAVGWAASGSFLFNPMLFTLMLFMYLWQIPHFLIILLRYGSDYKTAGLPYLFSGVTDKMAKAVIFFWLLAAVLSTALFPVFGLIRGTSGVIIMSAVDILIVAFFIFCFSGKEKMILQELKSATLNIFQFSILLLGIIYGRR